MHACESHKRCVTDALQTAEAICEDKALRFTDLRRQVLKLIWENHGPAKAYYLLGKLKGRDAAKPPIVYRTLDFLQEHGLVHKISSLNAYVGCSHPLKHNECYFLICSQCREIKECCSPSIASAITGTAGKNHFKPRHITLEIEGECGECRH